jgi:hypothetical protein
MPKSLLCLNEFAREAHGNAVERGRWEKEPPFFPEIIAMCHSELSEALTEWRRGDGFPAAYYSCNAEMRVNAYCRCGDGIIDPQCLDILGVADDDIGSPCLYRGRMPRGVAIELADCILRIFDYCAHAEIDLEQALRDKLDYEIRPARKHGGKRK